MIKINTPNSAFTRAPRILAGRTTLMWCVWFCLITLCVLAPPALAVQNPPTISPGGYHVSSSSPQAVTITKDDPAASVYYTTSGETPTTSSTLYNGYPFNVGNAVNTVKAIAVGSGGTSTVTTAVIQIDTNTAGLTRTGLELWLKADHGVLTSSSNVTDWKDVSGNSRDATQATGANQPVLTTSAINGLPTVTFDGTNDHLALPSGFAAFTNGATIFAVVQPKSLSEAPVVDFGQAASGNNLMLRIGTVNGVAQLGTFSGTSGTFANSASPVRVGYAELLEAIHTTGNPNATARMFVFGRGGTANTAMNNIPNLTRTSNFVGKLSDGTGNTFNGNLSELLAYSRPLTDDERAKIRLILTRRYALSDQLVPAPAFSASTSTLAGPTLIAIGPSRATAVTKFTTDGTTPTTSSTTYVGPLLVSHTKTIKAINLIDGVSSTVSTVTYTLDPVNWPAPNTSPSPALDFDLHLPSNAVLQP